MPSERDRMHDEVVSLREYLDIKIEHEKELRDEWRTMNDQMVSMAKEYVDAKLDKMNEMREQISRERGQYETRLGHDADNKAMDMRVRAIENVISNYQGRLLVTLGVGGGIWGLVIIVIAHFWK